MISVLLFPAICIGAPVDDAIRQQQQIQLQQEQHRRELEREHLEGLERPPSGEDLRLPEVPKAAPGETCFKATSIELQGVTLLDQSEIDAITANYIGQCLSLPDVNNLVRDVTNAYLDKGYVTTRAAIPEQDFSSGHLVVLVVEGRVEGIEFKDGQEPSRELAGAFPGMTGESLNLRDIEQGLDQMNRLPSNNARMELVPGTEPGMSRIVVENEKSRSWRLSVGQDNSGQQSTGRNQYVVAFGKDNLLGLNDLLDVHVNGDSEAWEIGEHQRSGTSNVFYSIPLGYWTFSTSLSRYDYRTAVQVGAAQYSSYGNTTTTVLSVDRVLGRNADSKTSFGVSYTHRDTQNYFDSIKLVATSQVLAVGGASLNHSRRLWGGLISGHLGVSHGFPILGARRDRNPAPATPRAEFTKITFGGSYYRPFAIGDARCSWSTMFSGQWSEHTLYSAERFGIGSRYTVRGFQDDSLSGDTGAYVRNELALDVTDPGDASTMGGKLLGKVQLYAGYDVGGIKTDDKELEERGSIQGAVLGIRTTGGSILLDMAVARPLDAPAFMKNDEIEFYTSIQYAF